MTGAKIDAHMADPSLICLCGDTPHPGSHVGWADEVLDIVNRKI